VGDAQELAATVTGRSASLDPAGALRALRDALPPGAAQWTSASPFDRRPAPGVATAFVPEFGAATSLASLGCVLSGQFAAISAEVLDCDVLRRWASPDVSWDAVVRIESCGWDRIYDFNVPGTHNFVAADLFVHNTAIGLGIATNVAKITQKPVLIFSLIFNIALGMVSRLIPQVQVFMTAMPLSIILSLAVIALGLGGGLMIWLEAMETQMRVFTVR
jgi:hypothetical protein